MDEVTKEYREKMVEDLIKFRVEVSLKNRSTKCPFDDFETHGVCGILFPNLIKQHKKKYPEDYDKTCCPCYVYKISYIKRTVTMFIKENS